MENGSGGFLSDLTFVGGNFGYVFHDPYEEFMIPDIY